MTEKLGLRVLGLVVVALLLAVNCAEDGTAPDTNLPPNTFITNYQIDIAPDSATAYMANISWSGNDVDGAIFWYEWRVKKYNPADLDDSVMVWYVDDGEDGIDTLDLTHDWQATNTQSLQIKLDYPNFDTRYFFQVRAQDNDRSYDPTPAVDTISIDRIRDYNYAPNTEIVVGPPNGALCGEGINFLLKGTDIDGVVDTIAYMIDAGAWQKVPTDITTGTLNFNLRNLATGARTITFKAIDNFRKEDPSPVSVSVTVVDTLAPEVALSVLDNQSFMVPFTTPTMDTLTVNITATVDFYYSYVDSFRIQTSEGDDIFTTDISFNFYDVGSGSYWINVTAFDIGGNSNSTGQVDFSIVELPAGDGVLCVNGVDWATYGQAPPMWDDGVPWGNRTHFKCWDLFDTTPLGSVPDMADSLLGTGSIPEWLFDTTFFDAISWFGNAYSGDFDYWEEREDAIMAYLEMGGNILLPVRYGSDWFFDDLATYAGIVPGSWVAPGIGDSLTAKITGLTNVREETEQSLWEIPTTNNSNNVILYEAVNAAPGGHAGFVTLPNGEGGGGAFCYIAGRNYRWENADFKAAVDKVLDTYFGITN